MFRNTRGDLCNPLLERTIDHRRAGGMLSPPVEFRNAVEVRASGRQLSGIAAPFNSDAAVGNFHERILPGAFEATLRDGHDVLALVDHDEHRLLGRTKSGTLRLCEAPEGLAFELDVADTALGRDVLTMVERRDMAGCSFAFRPRPSGEKWIGRRRELRSVDLVEISLVHSWVAYQQTSIQARMAPSMLGGWQRRLWLETV